MKNTLLIFTLILVIASASVSNTMAQITYPLSGHPRLFFLATDTAVLRAKLNATPVLKRVHDQIIIESDRMLTLPVLKRVLIVNRMLDVSREALHRICYLSYSYRMTGNVKYAQRAEAEMLATAAFSDWNPSHFLDVGEMTLAMAIGYDWLYGYLSATSRTKIATAIKSKGIEKSAGQAFLTADNNWNQVCNAGISAGVAAVYDENPTYYQTLIDRGVNSIKTNAMTVYSNNGTFPEGYSYWEYGTTFNCLFIDLLQRMWNTDRGLLAVNGFLSTVNFVTHMQGNSTKQIINGTLRTVIPQPFNFADCGAGVSVLPGMFWLAAGAGNTNCLYGEIQKLNFILDTTPANIASNRLLPFLLIWSMNLSLTNLPAPVETTYLAQGKSAVTTLRTGWGINDIYLAMKGGTSSQYHSHMDVGSFVMDANDIRWAVDLGMSEYNALESNGVDLWNLTQTSERWDVFRINCKAHNTLTINGNKQLVAGSSLMENFVNTANLKSVQMNLAPLYQNDVTVCRRTGAIISNRYVEIKDSIKAKTTPLTIRWNLATQAVPQKISNKIIKLYQAGKTLYLIFDGTDNVEAKAWGTRPPNVYEEPNTDYYFTGFEFKVAANATQKVTVKMVPAGDPILNGLDLSVINTPLNEDFEAFSVGSSSNGFVSWKMNPSTNGALKALYGEVVANPFKSGINTSNNVFRIKRQEDSVYITTANASMNTYRGSQAYGYDLRLNTASVVELKYYKDTIGKIGVRVYDGDGNVVPVDFTDPHEKTANYSTAKWRTAQFAVGRQNLTNFNFSPSGYLLVSPEREFIEASQEKELTIYVDDVKMLPLPTSSIMIKNDRSITAFYDPSSNRICVRNLPENTKQVKLFNLTGQLLEDVLVSGDVVLLNCKQNSGGFYIVQAIDQNGTAFAIKVAK